MLRRAVAAPISPLPCLTRPPCLARLPSLVLSLLIQGTRAMFLRCAKYWRHITPKVAGAIIPSPPAPFHVVKARVNLNRR